MSPRCQCIQCPRAANRTPSWSLRSAGGFLTLSIESDVYTMRCSSPLSLRSTSQPTPVLHSTHFKPALPRHAALTGWQTSLCNRSWIPAGDEVLVEAGQGGHVLCTNILGAEKGKRKSKSGGVG
jgi:hypothetical protein